MTAPENAAHGNGQKNKTSGQARKHHRKPNPENLSQTWTENSFCFRPARENNQSRSVKAR
jgi:hypothetical protein